MTDRVETSITDLDALRAVLNSELAVLLYFEGDDCSVCKVVKPQIVALQARRFPKMRLLCVNAPEQPEIAAQLNVFAVPTLIAFFEGRETIRRTRQFALGQLEAELARLYDLAFEPQ